jgi:hypothetical protein
MLGVCEGHCDYPEYFKHLDCAVALADSKPLSTSRWLFRYDPRSSSLLQPATILASVQYANFDRDEDCQVLMINELHEGKSSTICFRRLQI